MIRETLPENPQERKVIVLMEDVEIINSDKKGWINSPDIVVLEYPFEDESIKENELYKSLEAANLIKQGAVLAQSPYDLNLYNDTKDIESFVQSNALQKYLLFSEFCRKLGATRIYGKHIESEQNTKETNISGKGGYNIAEIATDINRNLETKLSQELVLEDSYVGNSNPNIEEARKFLFDNHISHDKVFTSLLEARMGNDKITSRKLFFSLTNDSLFSLKLAGSIKFALFNAEGSYESKVHSLKDLKVVLNVVFEKG